MLKNDSNALLEQVAGLLRPYVKVNPTDSQLLTPLPAKQYENLLDMREKLCKTALVAVRALLTYDSNVLSHYYAEDSSVAVTKCDLARAIRACAPLIKYKSDWAALLMLCRDCGIEMTETRLARIIASVVPNALLPSKQNLQSGQWDTLRKHFPDWPAHTVKTEKFQRYYAIAAAAQKFL